MNKRNIATLAFFCCIALCKAAIPEGYYDNAIGKSGSALQAALATIINHSDPGYDNLWSIYETTDRRSDGKVWDMYSNTTDFSFSDRCGNYSGEGDCFNREHSIPKSWRNDKKYSDVIMVVPTDGYVNNRRSNYPFGEVGSTTYVSDNSFSKVGSCITPGYSGVVFEPNDEYKGDFARIYFYAATRYHNECGNWGGNGFSGSFPHLDEWTRAMMLRWHEMDPVSTKEMDRNDAVYESRQKNRNPFVDYPELVDLIFGEMTSTPFSPEGGSELPYLETPLDGTKYDMGVVSLAGENGEKSMQIEIKGMYIEKDLTLSLSGSSYFSLSTHSIAPALAIGGTQVTITYAPMSAGQHEATLTISGGVRNAVNLTFSASAVEDFAAIDASHVTENSFRANWTRHSQATDYELSVWRVTSSESTPKTLFDVKFSKGMPSNWQSDGYAVLENGAVRLASSSKNGTVTTHPLDLSQPTTLTVTCSPYKTSDNSMLYILVDNNQVAQIDCSAGEVTETLILDVATSSSTISFKAMKSHRVYLKSASLTAGGGVENDILEGYPLRTGDVTQHEVNALEAQATYEYKVKAFSGATLLAESNTITVTTGNSSIDSPQNDLPRGIYIYASNGTICIDEAPFLATINCYSLDGTLCATRTARDNREVISIEHNGIYIVQLITHKGCYARRVVVY